MPSNQVYASQADCISISWLTGISLTNTVSLSEQAVSGSYAQTEMYFVEHSDYLMPRVHEMRTDLAQFYQSTKPSIRLQHMTSNDERVNFEINGDDLLLRDINVYCSTKANHRKRYKHYIVPDNCQ